MKFLGSSQGTVERPSLLLVVQSPFPEGSPLAQSKFFASEAPFQENPLLCGIGCKLVKILAYPRAEKFNVHYMKSTAKCYQHCELKKFDIRSLSLGVSILSKSIWRLPHSFLASANVAW